MRSLPVHHNAHMKIYRALEERGLALSFHSAINPTEPVFKSLNRFASVHGLGFPFYNILHMTNWVTNGLGERFPKLPVIWIEGGLAWVPFLMQRLDHEHMMRSSEYPLLKKKPSDYMRDMYYASQPMEAENMRALECTLEMETELCWAYNRWLTETALPEGDGRFYSMLCMPFSDPDESLRQVEKFGDRKHVGGFMVTTVRNAGVHENQYMKVYRAIEERGLVLSFHSGPNWAEPIFKTCNRFLAVHALGFSWYNILHCTNWVINGMCERFPKLPVIWIESGLAWVPFLMQKLDHEYMLRPSEAPLLKKKPSDYMRDMYYSTQPMEIQDIKALECTFRMINAETQVLYSSDYPHWDFDLPSTITDLPFLSEKAKHNILGGTAARLFKLPPRNEKQKENLKKFGNIAAAA